MKKVYLAGPSFTEFHGTSMDVGTAFEIGMAIQRGIPVVTYTEGARENYKERIAKKEEIRELDNGDVVDSKGMTVENFDLQENLMISALSEYTNKGARGAIEMLEFIL